MTPRPLSTIDAELRSIATLQDDAARQLDNLRRQQALLATHELSLMLAIDGRNGKVDRLLDERQDALVAQLEQAVQ